MKFSLSPQFKQVKKPAPALIKILPEMFQRIGLTMTNIKIGNSGWNLFFRIKEFSQRLHFDYDGSYLEFSVYHHGQNIDSLIIIAVPWVYKKDGKYYAHWTVTKHVNGPYDSIEKLMKRYLPGRLRRWIKKILPDSAIHIYKTRGGSWARVINTQKLPFPGDQECFLGEIKVWK